MIVVVVVVVVVVRCIAIEVILDLAACNQMMMLLKLYEVC
jgi:hypothetical protein